MNGESPNSKSNARSVGHLQHLYSVIIALGLVEAVKAVLKLGDNSNVVINLDCLPTFLAFLVTLVPFYHGANRYMDDIYLSPSTKIRPLTGLVDYLFFILEAITFYALALFIPYAKPFFIYLGILFSIDIIWLIFSYFNTPSPFNKVQHWLILNLLMAIILYFLIFSPVMLDDMKKWILLTVFIIARSVLDYILSWGFFWPVIEKNKE